METSLRPFTEEFVNEFENNLNWIYNAMYSIAIPLTIALTLFLSSVQHFVFIFFYCQEVEGTDKFRL